jgi:hypothetical protein
MRTATRYLLPLAALAALAGCSSGAPSDPNDPASGSIVDATVGRAFRLQAGSTARLPDGLLVGFRGVSSDSRCPTDVVCVWAGDATARIQATVGRMAWTGFDLHSTLEPKAATFREWKIRLIAVEPSPRSTEQIPANGYVVTLEVTRQ